MVQNYVWILISFLCIGNVAGQSLNLVSNPSFEEVGRCPKQVASLGKQLGIDDWITPTRASTDYFNSCNTYIGSVGVPKNCNGTEPAFDGQGYVGIIVGIKTNYCEYIQGKLRTPLQKGHTYHVSFYVSLSENSHWATSHLGCALLDKKYNSSHTTRLTFESALVQEQLIERTNGWTKIEFEYTAVGAEKYIIIGGGAPRMFYFQKKCANVPAKELRHIIMSIWFRLIQCLMIFRSLSSRFFTYLA